MTTEEHEEQITLRIAAHARPLTSAEQDRLDTLAEQAGREWWGGQPCISGAADEQDRVVIPIHEDRREVERSW